MARFIRALLATASSLIPSAGVLAQEAPVVVEGPVSEAIYTSQAHKDANDGYGYAAAHRAGDMLYVSGIVIGSWDDVVLDAQGLTEATRRGFETIGRILEAAGADYSNVVDLLSFHVWDSPYFDGDKREHMDVVTGVRREFMDGPDPAWTAVGTTGLIPDRGIIEIRVTAYVPR